MFVLSSLFVFNVSELTPGCPDVPVELPIGRHGHTRSVKTPRSPSRKLFRPLRSVLASDMCYGRLFYLFTLLTTDPFTVLFCPSFTVSWGDL